LIFIVKNCRTSATCEAMQLPTCIVAGIAPYCT